MAGNARCHIQGPLRGELAFWVVYSVGLSVGVGVGVFISRYGEFFLVGDFRPTWLEGGSFFFIIAVYTRSHWHCSIHFCAKFGLRVQVEWEMDQSQGFHLGLDPFTYYVCRTVGITLAYCSGQSSE